MPPGTVVSWSDAGFELLADEVVDTLEPEGPVPFLWVLGRRGSP